MHKNIYASGFLYHLETQQLLLHQPNHQKNKTEPVWSPLGGPVQKNEQASEAFQRIIYQLLNIKLSAKNIYPVYDYFHNSLNAMYYVFYAQVPRPRKFPPSKSSTPSWFTFKQMLKLPFTEETKQDVVVVQRVIKAQAGGSGYKT